MGDAWVNVTLEDGGPIQLGLRGLRIACEA